MQEETKKELKALAEKVSLEACESVFKIAAIEIAASENKYDDLLVPFLPLIKAKVVEAIQNIDKA